MPCVPRTHTADNDESSGRQGDAEIDRRNRPNALSLMVTLTDSAIRASLYWVAPEVNARDGR